MNERTEALTKKYKPMLVIAVYKGEGGYSNDKSYYLESHNFNERGQLLEGKPLKQQTISEIVDVFFDERQNQVKITGLIPDNLLLFEIAHGGKYDMIWYRPEEKRQLFFADGLHIPSGLAWVPALLYRVQGNSLEVYALPDNTRPVPATKLFHAPFHNVSEGSVCLGSAAVKKPDKKTFHTIMKYWEDLFWLSEFSHLAASVNPTRSNLSLLWKQLIGKEKKWSDFKPGELKSTKSTFEDLLD